MLHRQVKWQGIYLIGHLSLNLAFNLKNETLLGEAAPAKVWEKNPVQLMIWRTEARSDEQVFLVLEDNMDCMVVTFGLLLPKWPNNFGS